ncbi:MAG: transglycosylase SLT domain-containing protein [bacterium]|nr:transglycosylase SLT domain-containing protein [bacterium]
MGRRGTDEAKCRRAFAVSVGARSRAGVLLACGLGVLAPALAAGQAPVSAEEANAAFERFEQARIAAFEGDEAERYRAAIAELDTAAADLRQIEAAVVAAVQEERAAVWGEPTTDERFVWVEYSEDERERRQIDFAREALVFESLDGGIEGEALRRRVRAALVESIDEAVARDPIAQGIETQAAATLATGAPLESGALASTPILWPVLTGDARVEESALEAVVGLLVARAQTRQVEIGAETMQQVEIPLDPATVLAQLERLERGDFAAPMPGFTPQEIPRPKPSDLEPEPAPALPRAEAPSVRPPPVPQRFPSRARVYLDLVDRYARARRLDPALVFAIIETESAFNPLARSSAPAYGLMQIVPRSAGLDASAVLYGRPRLLAPSYLFDAERNIRIGAIYLDIVLNRYLAGIRDPRSRLYCAIAAYNTGAGNVFRAFTGRTRPKAAFREINALSPEDVYRRLVWQLPYAETRRYLTNVVQRMDKYRR